MKWFEIKNVPSIRPDDMEWITHISNNPTNPLYASWTIIPHLMTQHEISKLSYIFDALPISPSYAAIITVPKNSVCATHVDDKADASGIRQRITAINIPVNVHETSVFQYMESMESNNVLETIDLQTPKCWRVDIPHRIDNSKSPHNRIVISMSYVETINELHQSHLSTF